MKKLKSLEGPAIPQGISELPDSFAGVIILESVRDPKTHCGKVKEGVIKRGRKKNGPGSQRERNLSGRPHVEVRKKGGMKNVSKGGRDPHAVKKEKKKQLCNLEAFRF